MSIKSAQEVSKKREMLLAIKNSDINFVVIKPFYRTKPLINDSITITNVKYISEILNACQRMTYAKQGDGNTGGDWQIELNFVLINKKKLHSFIYHNSFSNLIYLSESAQSDFSSPEDLFSSHEISQILNKIVDNQDFKKNYYFKKIHQICFSTL